MRMKHPATMTAEQRDTIRKSFAGSRFSDFESLPDGSLICKGVDSQGRLLLIAFAGKAVRPSFNFYYKVTASAALESRVAKFKATILARAEAVTKRRAERSAPHSLLVGSILYTSWGYDQTNVEFYQVVAVRGRVVDVREIAQSRKEIDYMQGTTCPVRDHYIGDILLGKRPRPDGSIRIDDVCNAHVWDGQSKSWSSGA